jgi:cytochrome c-type biogenesis protein CcmH/NrfG
MDDGKGLRKALALEPADAPTLGGNGLRSMDNESAADARARRDLHITTSDEFLARAAKEYQAGTIDQALWRRAADQGGTDASLVIAAYLRSRALALQLQQKKDESSAIQARGAAKTRAPGDPKLESKPNEKITSTLFVGDSALRPKSKRWQMTGAVVALAVVAAIAFQFMSPEEIESAHAPMAAARAPANPSSPPAAGQPDAKNVNADPGDVEPAFPVRIQQLKEVGKWNVLVLYASEWTRREPGNAIAWSELGNGYAQLRQYNDAIEAATKAVQLAPQDPFTWRNLGHINLAVDRVPEAGVAFAKALALRPDDADALCGAAAVALRQARPKDADGVTKQVKVADGTCPN